MLSPGRWIGRCTKILLPAALALVGGLAPAASLAAPPGPNLGITYDGFNPSSADRVIRFKITNVGTETTDAAMAHIQQDRGSPTSNVDEPNIPSLPPGASYEVYYLLYKMDGTVGCDGAIVEATVYLANDVDQSNNSVGPMKVCSDLPPPVVVGPAPQSAPVIPEEQRPGTHTLVFDASNVDWRYHVETTGDGCELDPLRIDNLPSQAVGWGEADCGFFFLTGHDSHADVTQTAAQFGLGRLDQIPNRLIARAWLTFTDEKYFWTDGDGNDIGLNQRSGCVTTLGIATTDWLNNPQEGLFPNDTYQDQAPLNTTEFDVTSPVQLMIASPGDPSLRYGFVLRGAIEQLNGDDNSACMSIVNKIQLHITYVVPTPPPTLVPDFRCRPAVTAGADRTC